MAESRLLDTVMIRYNIAQFLLKNALPSAQAAQSSLRYCGR